MAVGYSSVAQTIFDQNVLDDEPKWHFVEGRHVAGIFGGQLRGRVSVKVGLRTDARGYLADEHDVIAREFCGKIETVVHFDGLCIS